MKGKRFNDTLEFDELHYINRALQATCCISSIRNSAKNLSRYRQYFNLERAKQVSRKLICSGATDTLPKPVEESKIDTPKEIFLKDYKMPDYYFKAVDLKFSLGEEKTIVSTKIIVLPRVEGSSSPLVLVSVKVNRKDLKEEDFYLDSRHLTLWSPPSGIFTLEIVSEIYPHKNTSLEGLYKSLGNFCTQCEVEGFRKITFYQDRPDIMSVSFADQFGRLRK